jgi:hypothetical protein
MKKQREKNQVERQFTVPFMVRLVLHASLVQLDRHQRYPAWQKGESTGHYLLIDSKRL